MAEGFTLRLKQNGRLMRGSELRGATEQYVDPGLVSGATLFQGGIRGEAPIRTKALWLSFEVRGPEWQGDIRLVRVVTDRVYAVPVNKRGLRAGYLERGIAGARERAIDGVRKGVGELAEHVWQRR